MRTDKIVTVVFRAETWDFVRKEFSDEEDAKEFSSKHPGAFLVINRRISTQGGQNGGR